MTRQLSVVISLLLLVACAPRKPQAAPLPATTPGALPAVVSVYASPAAQPWLDDVYACAGQTAALVRLAASPQADIYLRVGEPAALLTPAYRIGSEDILVVTRRDSPLQSLTATEVRALFSQGRQGFNLWVFASGTELQEIFERELMAGSRIHFSAQLALHPSAMLEALTAGNTAVGILPRRWKDQTLRELFTLADLPVLAITPAEPRGAAQEIIACLQGG